MDDDQLRNAFQSIAEPEREPARDVLASVRPRMRRRRFLRRASLAGAGLSAMVVLGVGLAAVRGDDAERHSVATMTPPVDASPVPEVEPTASGTTAPPPSATEVAIATPPSGAAVGADPTVPGTSSTSPPGPTATPLVDVPATPIPATTVTPLTIATPTPTTLPTPSVDAVTPSAAPTATPTTTPDAGGEPMVDVIGSDGGAVTVRYTERVIVAVEPDPAPGYSSEIEKEEPTEVKVLFRDGQNDVIEIEIHLADGELDVDISPEGGES